MEKYVQVLQKTALFQDIEPGDIVQMLRDMGSHVEATVQAAQDAAVFR